jgi:uncharacterized paraquat-inducible protein A
MDADEYIDDAALAELEADEARRVEQLEQHDVEFAPRTTTNLTRRSSVDCDRCQTCGLLENGTTCPRCRGAGKHPPRSSTDRVRASWGVRA